jgi:hypothetical protein
MLTCLSVLASLEVLEIEFCRHQSHLYWASRRLRRVNRTVLPILKSFLFTGASGYLDDLVAWIDASQLVHLVLFLFDQPMYNS